MTVENSLLVMKAGTTKYLVVNIIGQDGNKLDMNGVTIADWVLHDNKQVVQARLTKSLGTGTTITDATNGQLTIKLDPIDTESLVRREPYYYKVKIVNNGDTSIPATGSLLIEL